jgi:RNA exonuclease 4
MMFFVKLLQLFLGTNADISQRVSAHLSDRNHRKGTKTKQKRSLEVGAICFCDASVSRANDETERRSGVCCFYGEGEPGNFSAKVERDFDTNALELLAFLVSLLRADKRKRLTVYTDSRYVLLCVDALINKGREKSERRKGSSRRAELYLKCVYVALSWRTGRTIVHKVKSHSEGGGRNNGSSYLARLNNSRADALAKFGAESDCEVFENRGIFWGLLIALFRFASSNNGNEEEEEENNTMLGLMRENYDDDGEDDEDAEERMYYEFQAKQRPFGLGALRVVRNGKLVNLFDEKEENQKRNDNKQKSSGPPKPLNDDFSITDALALDCEMVGTGLGGVKSLLGQVSIVNEYLNVVYTSYCKPTEPITDYRTQWSGLTEIHLRDAPSFQEVQQKVIEIFNSSSDSDRKIIMTGHGLENDLECLRITHAKELIRDTALWKPILRPPHFKKPQRLRKLAKIHCNFSIQRTSAQGVQIGHDPSEDAMASMALYLKFKTRWENDIANRGVTRANISTCRYKR